MDTATLLTYSIALVLAIATVGWLFGDRNIKPAHSSVVAMILTPEPISGNPEIQLHSSAKLLHITSSGLKLPPGAVTHLVLHQTQNQITIIERCSYTPPDASAPINYTGQAEIATLPHRQYQVRYESEITGHWALFSYLHIDKSELKQPLKL